MSVAATLSSRASSGSELLFLFLLPTRVREEGQDKKPEEQSRNKPSGRDAPLSVAATLSSRTSSGSESLFVFSLLPARVQGEDQDKITRGTEQKQSRNKPSDRDASLPVAATLNSRASRAFSSPASSDSTSSRFIVQARTQQGRSSLQIQEEAVVNSCLFSSALLLCLR